MSKNQYDPQKTLELLEYIKEKISKETEHSFEKMVLQENYITVNLNIILICLNWINYSTLQTLNKKGVVKIQFKEDYLKTQKIPTINYKKESLGNFPKLLESAGLNYLDDSEMIEKLKEFNKIRNDLTHNIYIKYKTIKNLENEIKDLCKKGDELIVKMDRLRDRLFEIFQEITKILHSNNN